MDCQPGMEAHTILKGKDMKRLGKLMLIAAVAVMAGIGGCKSDFQISASQQAFYKGENKGQLYKSRRSAGENHWNWGRSDSIGREQPSMSDWKEDK